MTEFGMVTQVGRSIFLGVNDVPVQRGRPQHPQHFGTLPMPKQFDLQQPNLVWCGVGCSMFLGGQGSAMPHHKGWGPSVPQIFETLPTPKRFDLE